MIAMKEREKMLQGLLYDSRDGELIDLYWHSREVLQEFNGASMNRDRMLILQRLLGELAPDAWIETPFHCEYGAHIRIGSGTYVGTDAIIQDCGQVVIGKNTLIGPSLRICTASHPVRSSERLVRDPKSKVSSYVTSASPVVIGDRVWIGANVTILGGVTIGDDAVIGAGSVVTRHVPASYVACGVPCKIVRAIDDSPHVS
jgi:maltose O-acetyltransferase